MTDIDAARIHALVSMAVLRLRQDQPTLSRFTSQTHQTEWNLTHHFAAVLAHFFDEYDCDVDVSKPDQGSRRPDIVIHERGTHEKNLLVVEVKRDLGDINGARAKIGDWWFREPLRYRFGAVVVLNARDASDHVEVLERTNFQSPPRSHGFP
jgi:hypothetical protein